MRILIAMALVAVALPCCAQDGAALYLQGEGIEASLLDGKLRVPGHSFACGGCHGADASGGTEGGTDFPPIAWPVLTDVMRADGGYDLADLAQALREGVAPDGRKLAAAMPRYVMDDAQVDALAAYLGQMKSLQRRGVNARSVTLKIEAEMDNPGLAAVAARLNSAGGIFGRELHVTAAMDDPAFMTDAELAALVNPRIEQQQDRLIEAAGRDQVRILRFGQQADSMTEGPIRAISLAPDLAAQAIAAGLPPVSFRPYLQAVMLEQALIACGRDLTRACVEAALPRIDMAPFLHLYTLDN